MSQSAAARAARTRKLRAEHGLYSGERRTKAQAEADRAERGEETLAARYGPAFKVKDAHRDAAGRAYVPDPGGEPGAYFFRLPPGGQPPEEGEVLGLSAPRKGERWRARVTEVEMDAAKRRCHGAVVLQGVSPPS